RARDVARSARYLRSLSCGLRLSLADNQRGDVPTPRGGGEAQLSYQGYGRRFAVRATRSRPGPRRGAEPAMRRGRLLPALGLRARRLRADSPLVIRVPISGTRA